LELVAYLSLISTFGFSLSTIKKIIVLLANGSQVETEPATMALRYASTAAALDLDVEIHVVGGSAKLLLKDSVDSGDLFSKIRVMKSLDVKLYVCSAALAEAALSLADLIPEVDGVRGAAALLVAGLAEDARILTF
jgi:predicted peroxiredoxin